MKAKPQQSDSTVSWLKEQIKNAPQLTEEQKTALHHTIYANQDKNKAEEAIRLLTEANLGLVVQQASKYRLWGLEMSDLIQEGSMGLMAAIRSFNPTRNIKLSTYAIPAIKWAIIAAVHEQGRISRVPDWWFSRSKDIDTAYGVLAQKLQREPTVQEIAEELGIDVADIKACFDIDRAVLSLNHNSLLEESLANMLEDRLAPSPEQEAIAQELFEWATMQLLDSFTNPIDRRIIELHYGLTDQGRFSLSEIARMFGTTKSAIQEREARVLANMKAIAWNDKYRGVREELLPKGKLVETPHQIGMILESVAEAA